MLSAATVTWDGGAGTSNWSDASNWDTESLPTATDDVVISNFTVILDVNSTIQRISVEGTADFTINSGITLTINGFDGDAGMDLGGSTIVTNNGTIAISDITGANDDNPNGIHHRNVFTNNGDITISNVSKHGLQLFGGTFTNASGSSLSISNTASPVSGADYINMDDNSDGDIATFNNSGTVTINMSSGNDDAIYMTTGSVFNNSGDVTITSTGTTVDNGVRVNTDAIFNNNAGASLTISGTPDDMLFLDDTGTFNNAGAVTLTDALDVSLYITDETTFTNQSTGTITISNSTNISIQVDANGNTAALINDGSINVSGGVRDGIRLQELGALTNNSGSSITILAPGQDGIHIESSGGTVGNEGSIVISDTDQRGMEIRGGTITNEATIDISNTGTEGVDVNGGILNNEAGGLLMIEDITNQKGIEINDGTVNNSGQIEIANIEDEGMDIISGGTFNNLAGGLFQMVNSNDDGLEINGTFNNDGDVRIYEFGNDGIEAFGGSSVTNSATATYEPATSLAVSIGELEIKGDFDMGSSTTTFEISGTLTEIEFDRIDHFAATDETATLTISNATAYLEWGAYVPAGGEVFKIVDGSGLVSGEFNSVISSNPAIDFTVDYSDATEVAIVIAEALPVELTTFQGEILPKGTSMLKWETATETENDYFDLEYSIDGETFFFLSRIEGGGNTTTNTQYAFEHENVRSEMNYYRLKQVDFDGTSTYSSVIVLRYEFTGGESLVYPNPARDVIVYVGAEATLTVYDAYGKQIQQFQAQTGAETVDIRELRPGTYVLEIINADDSREIKRFIKQ